MYCCFVQLLLHAGGIGVDLSSGRLVNRPLSLPFPEPRMLTCRACPSPTPSLLPLPAAPQCNLLFVLIQLRMLRQHSRFDSLLRMVPCDMWRALRGRTLWLVGDSQAQVRAPVAQGAGSVLLPLACCGLPCRA